MAHVRRRKLNKVTTNITSVTDKNIFISVIDNIKSATNKLDSTQLNNLKSSIDREEDVNADNVFESIGIILAEAKVPSTISKMDIFKTEQFKPQQEKEVINMEETRVPPIVSEGPPCPICASRRTIEMSKQNKSGDEATRAFVRCTNCGSLF